MTLGTPLWEPAQCRNCWGSPDPPILKSGACHRPVRGCRARAQAGGGQAVAQPQQSWERPCTLADCRRPSCRLGVWMPLGWRLRVGGLQPRPIHHLPLPEMWGLSEYKRAPLHSLSQGVKLPETGRERAPGAERSPVPVTRQAPGPCWPERSGPQWSSEGQGKLGPAPPLLPRHTHCRGLPHVPE